MEFYRTSGAESQPSRVEVSSTCTGVGGRVGLIDNEFKEQQRSSDSTHKRCVTRCEVHRFPIER